MNEVRWATRTYDGYAIRETLEPDVSFLEVGPATPTGEYLRRFWHPVAMSSQLDEGKPVPIKVLCEDLIAFRDLSGRVGILHKHCAHRRASLEFGRLEKQGIRCCYHGWHFDIDGTILETPGEPKDSQIRHRICQGAYPAKEFKGLIFCYMGPPEEQPEFPLLDSMEIEGHDLVPYSIHSPCNWLQETENAIDPFHSVFLHGRISGPQFPGLEHFLDLPVVRYRERHGGIIYAHARRSEGDDLVRLRFHDYLLPNAAQNGGMFQVMNSPKAFGRTSLTKWVVPLDNVNSRKFGWRHFNDTDEVLRQGDRNEVGWEKVDFYGQTAHRSLEERQSNPGDWEAWTSQGPMNVHKREYLGKTDEGVALLRSRLRRDIKRVEQGQAITALQPAKNGRIPTYGGDTVLKLAQDPKDDAALLASVIESVMDIHIAAGHLEAQQRAAYISDAIDTQFPGSM